MKSYEDCKREVAQKHKLGNTLVTGHRATYFEEAAELYAESKVKNLSLSDVIHQVCDHEWHRPIINADNYQCSKCGVWKEQTCV